MAHDVFVSYSSEDKPTADAVVHSLESRGIRCWIAPRDVIPGENWAKSLIQAINEARAMVLVFSGNSDRSPQVLREVERAIHKGIPVIPFRIENIIPSSDMEFYLSTPHWLDAFPLPVANDKLLYLSEVLQKLFSKSTEPLNVRKLSTPLANNNALAKKALVAVAVIALIGFGCWFIPKNWGARSPIQVVVPVTITNIIGNLQSVNTLDPAAKFDTNSAEYYVYRGFQRQNNGDTPGALADYTTAIAMNPQLGQAYCNRSLLRINEGDFVDGMDDCNKVIELLPNFADGWNNRGYVKMQVNDLNGAIADFNHALQISPNFDRAKTNLQIALSKQQQQQQNTKPNVYFQVNAPGPVVPGVPVRRFPF